MRSDRGSTPFVPAGMLSSSKRCGEVEYVSGGSLKDSSSALLISCQRGMSSQSTSVIAVPDAPARPVRPMRCRYVFSSSGDW